MSAAGPLTYRYCVRALDVHPLLLPEFREHARRVWNDPRGWSLGGAIRFLEVPETGPRDFTLWLCAAHLVPRFGPPCSTFYSCRIRDDIVINLDRWRQGVPRWLRPLADYQTMALNHELGHWLGLTHVPCPGRFRRAPIMQQQSKGLQGCRPTCWPSRSDRRALARSRGIHRRARWAAWLP